MREQSLNKFLGIVSVEERVIRDYKEIPCKDMDMDCFAFDGKVPFGNYEKCYNYSPELGRCVFCEWDYKNQEIKNRLSLKTPSV